MRDRTSAALDMIAGDARKRVAKRAARPGMSITIGLGDEDDVREQGGVGHRGGDMGLDDPDSETQGYADDEDEELPGRRR